MQQKEANTIEDIDLLRRKGLEPVDFLKYTLALPGDTVDDIIGLGLGIDSGLVPPEHPWNSLGEDMLQQICLPDGSSIRSKIPQATELYSRNEDCQLIPGLLEATITLAEEKAKGRKSFRNFTRRLNRSATKRNKERRELQITFSDLSERSDPPSPS